MGKENSGQSTIELVLVLLLIVVSSMFFIKTALMFGFGNYVQYATYMSARTLMAGAATSDIQRQNALKVIEHYLVKDGGERYKMLGRGVSSGDASDGPEGFETQIKPRQGGLYKGVRGLAWYEGVAYTFKSRLFSVGLGRGGPPASSEVTLKSEAWLGREPSADECKKWFKDPKNVGQAKMPAKEEEYLDNGC